MRRTPNIEAVVLVLLCLVGSGCRNSCQQVCVRMAQYAEDCGFSIGDAELAECIEEQGSALEKEDRKTCRDFGDAEAIRREWTCDDIDVYFGTGGTE